MAIPALNEERYIETCIRSLMDGDLAMRSVPFVVADGGSTDKTQSIVRRLQAEFPNLSLIHNPRRNQAAGVNLVAQRYRGRASILVRCDAHSAYPPGFVCAVASRLSSLGADSVVVPMDTAGATPFQRAVAFAFATPFGSGGAPHRGGHKSGYVDHGHHAAFRLERFLSLSGYDESFSHNEDAEYDARLKAMGGTIYLDASVRVNYFPRTQPLALARQYFDYGRGRAGNILKNATPVKLRQFIPLVTLALNLGGLVAGIFYPPALILPTVYLAAMLSVSLYAVWKLKGLSGLAAGLSLIILHHAWALGFYARLVRHILRPARRVSRSAESAPASNRTSLSARERQDVQSRIGAE